MGDHNTDPRHLQGRINPAAFSPRQRVTGFLRDQESATLLRHVLAAALDDSNQIHVASFSRTLEILANMPAPEIVIVDISGEEQALDALAALAELIQPGTTVLAVGDPRDIDFYRAVTKGMGVREYLPKPLNADALTRYFLDKFKMDRTADPKRRGRTVAVAGTRGGAGTSTIAGNLAWLTGVEMRRHTLLLDTDLHSGTVALDLNVKIGPGLSNALESPERIDELLLERAAQPVADRLSILAAMEPHAKRVNYGQKAAHLLIKSLQQRYGLIVGDCGSKFWDFSRDLLRLADQIIVIVEPSLIATRNLERMLDLFVTMPQTYPMILVLNRAGRPCGLSQNYLERTLGLAFDAIIPDLPNILPKATQFGKMGVLEKSPFREAMIKLAKMVDTQTVPTPGL